ncbi:c-type cytochrome [Candidatus Poribacteria bacterium]|nr:c-type cytochrome [Candidatus Poribacteria bacterium]
MSKTLIKIVCFVLMVVSFIAYVARASAFPITSANLLPWSIWFLIFALANISIWQRVMRLLSFSLLVIWFYAFAANIVPSTSTAAVDVSSIERTPEAFIEAGQAIFNGKGKCHTCHTLDPSGPKGRCPDLIGVGTRAATRKPGMTAKQYFIESLYEPSAYLVPGYGKIMPPVWKPPIGLSNLEIETVIAFLQSQGGEVDVTPFKPPVVTGSATAEAEALPPILSGDPERGKTVFVQVAKCIACHNIAGIEKPAGQTLEGVEVVTAPDLTDIAALNSMRYIEESILKPNAEIVSGYGSATVQVGGTSVQGTLVSQDNEKIVLRMKDAGGKEEERTILLSELSPEPINELADLKKKGYFWIQATPADATAPISGEFVSEDDESITLKVGAETKKISKSNVKSKVTVTTFNGDKIVGELVSENADKIVLNVEDKERTIDPFDVDTKTYSRAFGKRIAVTSPMPQNFAQLLTVSDFNDLLAFLSTLKGAATEATVAATGSAPAAASTTEATPAE